MPEPKLPRSAQEPTYNVPINSLDSMLDKAGLRLSDDSPLTALLAFRDGETGGDLGDQIKADDDLDWPENWPPREEAIACLTQRPVAAVQKLLLDQVTDHFVFPWTQSESYCLYAHARDFGQLIAPVEPGQIAAFLAEDFNPLGAPPANGTEIPLSKEGFCAFAAIADYCRYIYAAGLMERTAVAANCFTIDQLEGQARLAQEKCDYRWLLSCWPHFYPKDEPVDRSGLEAGCTWLVEHGFIEENAGEIGGVFGVGMELLSTISRLINTVAVYHSADHNGDVTIFIAADALWRIDLSGKAATLVSIDGLELITGLRTSLTPSAPPIEDASDPASSMPTCNQCSEQMKPLQKFCSNCGTQSVTQAAG